MKKAVLLGPQHLLASAYPPELRARLGQFVDLNSSEIPPESWRDHRAALSGAELIFSTWGMPVLDQEFLAATPSLKAVFYAAGTVKSFVTPEAVRRDIIITTAAEANGLPVAEYALAVILLSLKNFWAYPVQASEAKFTKVAVIKKIKVLEDGSWVAKVRFVVDMRRSGVNGLIETRAPQRH